MTNPTKPARPNFDVYANPLDDRGICLSGDGAEKLAVYLLELESH